MVDFEVVDFSDAAKVGVDHPFFIVDQLDDVSKLRWAQSDIFCDLLENVDFLFDAHLVVAKVVANFDKVVLGNLVFS